MAYSYGYDMYDFITIFTAILPIVLLFALGFGFVFYIFNAIGVYQISKQRGYHNAWLAFIPIVSSYVLGGITDNINSCYGKKSSFRIWLLVLNIASVAISFTSLISVFASIFDMIEYSYYDSNMVFAQIFTSMTLFSSLTGLLSIAILVVTCISQYKIYTDYDGKNAMVYLILSILLSLSPFFLFAIRNKPSLSLYYAAQRNNQQNQPPFNGQGQSPYQPPFNNQGQPPYQPPMNMQGQPPYQPPMNMQGQPPYQPPMNNQGQSPYQPPMNNQPQPPTQQPSINQVQQEEQSEFKLPPQDPPQTPEL